MNWERNGNFNAFESQVHPPYILFTLVYIHQYAN